MSEEYLAIKVGDELTFDVLTWQHEGYEFGRPCLMLSPVIHENSDSDPESMIEDVAIDAVIAGKLVRNNEQQQIEWRQWNLPYLRRCFNAALKGTKTPIAGYRATRKRVRITWNEKEKRMDWEDVK